MLVPSEIVECLNCSEHYPEFDTLVECCPKCGNKDLENTIYLSTDSEMRGELMELFTKVNSKLFILD